MKKQLLMLLLFLAVPALAFGAKPKAVVLFYADDLGYGDTSVYGQAKVPTPNLERLAREGCRFRDAHSATPICTPSRFSLLTGRYAFRRPGTRILDGDAKLILPVEGSGEENVTLPVLMKRAGYRTAAIGKWHLGLGAGESPVDWNKPISPSPREVGFDRSFVMAATADRVPCVFIEDGKVAGLETDDPIEICYDNIERKWADEVTAHTNPELLKAWGRPSDRQHDKTIIDGISRIGHMRGGVAARWKDQELADRITSEAEAFIRESAGEPIFLYFAPNDIHVPRDPAPRFRGASGLGIRGDATVQMDDSLGRIRKALAENGYDDALFIFTSDNGPKASDGYEDGAREAWAEENPSAPFRGGKYTVYEGGTRVPMIVAWPGRVAPGTESDALVSQTDFARSLAKIVGVDVPAGACGDSQELSQALLGKSEKGRRSLVEQPAWGPWGFRKGEWKLIDSDSPQLYFLADDPGEQNNLASGNQSMVEELRSELAAARGETVRISPDGTNDMTRAVLDAVAGGKTVLFAGETYHFYPQSATPMQVYVSNHDQPMPRKVQLPIVNVRDVALVGEGDGAKFVFHGEATGILIMDSSRVRLENISLDWDVPPIGEARIAKLAPGSEPEFEWIVKGYDPLSPGMAMMLWDGKTRAIKPGTGDGFDIAKAQVGDVVSFRAWSRPSPAICAYRAGQVRFEDVVIHSAHGMGLLAQRSSNLVWRGGGVYPRTGCFCSTKADATHFSNCAGLVSVSGARFEGMMDDAINVHSTCLRIEEKIAPNKIRCRYVHPQAIGFETFAPGERLRFIRAATLENGPEATVESVERVNERTVVLALDAAGAAALADYGAGDAVENADWQPAVEFNGNIVRNNRARAALFTTPGRVVVRGNKFDRVSGSAILFAGDASNWYESGACQDVEISGNEFLDCLTSPYQFCNAVITVASSVPDLAAQKTPYHRNIRIFDNVFRCPGAPLWDGNSVTNVEWRNNSELRNSSARARNPARGPAWCARKSSTGKRSSRPNGASPASGCSRPR